MGTLSRGYSFGSTEQVTAAKLHSLVDDGTITGIVTADISDAQITDDKINDISGAKFTNLANIPAGAGAIPSANLTAVAQKGANSDITSLSGLSTPLSTAQGGTGSSANANAASGVVVLDGSSKLPAVDGSQLTGIPSTARCQLFTSNGNWTCPAGVTKAYITMIGGGAGGGNGNAGGGGSGASYVIKFPYTVTPTSIYAVVVGAGGTGGNNGGASTFDSTLSVNGGVTASGGTGGTSVGGFNASGVSAAPAKMFASGNGGNANSIIQGGGGGSTPWGLGTDGSTSDTNNINPVTAGNYGAGGGGGHNRTGGTGGSGFVFIEW